jgi:hypothetical protein
MSSLEDFANRMEKSGTTGSGSNNVTEKSIHEMMNGHSIQIDEKGKQHRVNNIDYKTEIYTPSVFTALEVTADWLKEEFPLDEPGIQEEDADTYLHQYDRTYKVNMVSKDRKSREEVVRILTSPNMENQDDEVKSLQKELSKI